MSLWAEHTGMIEDCFTSPESLECVRRVRSIGKMNWKQFAAEQVTEMRGHLMRYPVEVDRKGKVKPLPGSENFPDVGGNVVGSFLAIQENLTIWCGGNYRPGSIVSTVELMCIAHFFSFESIFWREPIFATLLLIAFWDKCGCNFLFLPR